MEIAEPVWVASANSGRIDSRGTVAMRSLHKPSMGVCAHAVGPQCTDNSSAGENGT